MKHYTTHAAIDNEQLEERFARQVFRWDEQPDELDSLEAAYLADQAEAELAMLSDDDERRCEEAAHRYASTAAKLATGAMQIMDAMAATLAGPNRAA